MPPYEDSALADRVTRLEVLREADRERLDEMRGVMNQMSAKLDLILGQSAQNTGMWAAVNTLFRGALPALWVAAIGGVGWALHAYIGQVAR